VLEKEAGPGRHQSTHNSGVLHCGLYYKPESLKARMAVEGIRRMTAFCRENDIAHDICGKLVVATNPAEKLRLAELLRRGSANGLHGLRKLRPAEWRGIEPNVHGLEALHVPEEGIVDYRQVVEVMARLLHERDATLVTSAEVCRLMQIRDRWVARTKTGGEYQADFLINCGGLHCDRIARMAGEVAATHIVPFRGEYHRLQAKRENLVNNLVYPVPDPIYPFLGVHFTRLITGGIECGPNAVLALAREGYDWSRVNFRDLAEVGLFPGFWRFLFRHRREAAREVMASLSKELFCHALQKLVPDLRVSDLAPGGSGVRAQSMDATGTLVQDFNILRGSKSLHLLNAPSPAATASLAIGRHLVAQL
jgi:L-2-hydroxyglutarate oxidase